MSAPVPAAYRIPAAAERIALIAESFVRLLGRPLVPAGDDPVAALWEAPLRDERQRLLERVTQRGFIDDYAGVRISATGLRFRIEKAVVWNLIDAQGRRHGQAATFAV